MYIYIMVFRSVVGILLKAEISGTDRHIHTTQAPRPVERKMSSKRRKFNRELYEISYFKDLISHFFRTFCPNK